jgi:hypothetical protein
MSAAALRIVLIVVTMVFLLGLGYSAWQTQSIIHSLERIASRQQETMREAPPPVKFTDEELRKIGSQVRFPGAEEWLGSIEKPLIAKVQSGVAAAQRREIEDGMKRWSDGARVREEKWWGELRGELREERDRARKQMQTMDERWKEMLAALRQEREAGEKRHQQERELVAKRSQQDEERWQKLLAAMRQEREENRKQYREIVRRLDEERASALERARQLEEEREREIVKRLREAEQIDRERKRLISEFCAKNPESAICRGP